MAISPNLTSPLLLLTLLVVLLPVQTYAFGAGDIPDFAYLNDKAFRHGDIENILETLAKSAGTAAIGGGSLLGFAASVIKHAKGESKFNKSDIKKVYFGNWLRDYSQAMDIAGLSKLSADTLVLIVSVLGFMTFGFASQEFEVTADRLGVYLPVEHIDNPRGYAEKEGDARNFHPKLRPPVDPRELEIDENTGMKNYIATENQGWDTSTAFIRRTFRSCIEHGRRAGGHEGGDLWEAYRLLGQGLHTMEDLLAHSNWCELALRKMGHEDVFCHVGDNVIINTPNGPAPPLVTGTFGSADFLHSLLGEATDHLSQASVTDLSQKMSDSQNKQGPDLSFLKSIFSKFGGGEDKLNKGEEIKQQSQGYNFNPDNICPPDVQQKLLELLKWHDDVLREIIKKIELVPGLSNLLDEFSNALNEYIYTILAPYLGPILSQATSVLDEGSKAVIDSDDQYEVFNNPDAHDPSHSQLSKDHFGLILNEPAGKIAQIVVEHSVNLIVRAWSNDENEDRVIDEILEAFHHPYYASGRSAIQEKMFDHMQRWIGGLGSEAQEILEALTKESVREHRNKRRGLEDTEEAGYGGCGHGHSSSTKTSAAVAGGYAGSQSSYGNQSGYNQHSSYNQGRNDEAGDDNSNYQQSSKTGGRHHTSGYGGSTEEQYSSNTYGRQNTSSYGDSTDYSTSATSGYTPSYGQSHGRTEASNTYGQGRTSGGYGSRRDDDSSEQYGTSRTEGYGGYGTQSQYDDDKPKHHNRHQRQDPDEASGYNNENSSGGRTNRREDEDNDRYGSQQSYGDRYSGRRVEDEDGGRHHGRQSGHGQETSGYGQQSSGYDRSDAYGEQPSEYGQRHGEHGRSSYGQASSGYGQEPSGSGGQQRSTYGEESSGYGQPRTGHHGYGEQQASSGYAPTYGGAGGYAPSYGGNDDTFGAERLNISGEGYGGDNDDEERHRHHRKHHGGY
ncbi:hypothetical protein D9613_004172 [Agrocybe pediades]|uniref:Het-C-domain-containing protein n=1 Tax=Agrocybe pediades TaxID=84607 RepID=A0A8H4QII7_9AGAR|nr:hypothetical protein D9613_004172 [Agrocybe pediades]